MLTDPHALVIGEALIDIVERVGTQTEEIPGGSPANVAITLGRLGRSVQLVTWLGRDPRGKLIAEHLRHSQVELSEGSWGASRTSTARAVIGEDGAASYEFDLSWSVPPTQIDDSVLVAHSGSIAATVEPGGSEVVRTLQQAQKHATITYDPNARPTIMGSAPQARERVEQVLALADVVKVSDEDVQWLYGTGDVDAVARGWLGDATALVVVTRGPRGATAFAQAGQVDIPAAAVDVVDTVGAGDSFMGALIDALWSLNLLGANRREQLRQISLEQMEQVLARASAVSAVTVSRAGANPPWKAELN